MQTRQRVILLFLVCLSLLQQGVRWQMGRKDVVSGLDNPVGIVVAQAASVEERHCELVHVNMAGMAELQTLPGIGPIYAERIITARREQPFLEITDLLRVSGIGEKRLAQISELICLYFESDAQSE